MVGGGGICGTVLPYRTGTLLDSCHSPCGVEVIQWDADEMRKTAFISLQRTLSMSPIFLHPSGSPVLILKDVTTAVVRTRHWEAGEGITQMRLSAHVWRLHHQPVPFVRWTCPVFLWYTTRPFSLSSEKCRGWFWLRPVCRLALLNAWFLFG